MTTCVEKINTITTLVDEALNGLYKNDSYLIDNKVHERSIVFRFAYYFQCLLNVSQFSQLNLDFEYNKNHFDPKKTTNFKRGTYPDIVLHERGNNNNNLLMIEFKTWWDQNNLKDIKKLRDFTDQNGKYKYAMGFSIVLARSRGSVRCLLVINAEVDNG